MIWVGFPDDGKDLDPNFKTENCEVTASMFLDIIKVFSFIHTPPSPIWRVIYAFKLFTLLNPCTLTGSSHTPTYRIWRTVKFCLIWKRHIPKYEPHLVSQRWKICQELIFISIFIVISFAPGPAMGAGCKDEQGHKKEAHFHATMWMNLENDAEWKKPDIRGHMWYDSILKEILRNEKSRDSNQFSGCQGLEGDGQ